MYSEGMVKLGSNLQLAREAAERVRADTIHRDALIKELVERKVASLRQIAQATGLCHSAVAKIAKR